MEQLTHVLRLLWFQRRLRAHQGNDWRIWPRWGSFCRLFEISTQSLLAIDGILTFFCLSRILLGVFLSTKRRDEWQALELDFIISNIWGVSSKSGTNKNGWKSWKLPYFLMDGFRGECSPPFKETNPIYHSNYPAKHTKINDRPTTGAAIELSWTLPTFQEHFHREERTVMPTAPARRPVLRKTSRLPIWWGQFQVVLYDRNTTIRYDWYDH